MRGTSMCEVFILYSSVLLDINFKRREKLHLGTFMESDHVSRSYCCWSVGLLSKTSGNTNLFIVVKKSYSSNGVWIKPNFCLFKMFRFSLLVPVTLLLLRLLHLSLDYWVKRPTWVPAWRGCCVGHRAECHQERELSFGEGTMCCTWVSLECACKGR